MSALITTIFTAALVNNLIFVHAVGLSPLFFFTRRLRNAAEFCSLATVLLFLASVTNLLLYRWVLNPLNIGSLALLLFIAVSAGWGMGFSLCLRRWYPLLAFRQEPALLLFSVSSAVIGLVLVNTASLGSIPVLILHCLGSALGFGLTMLAFTALRQRINHPDVPTPMRGAPLELISAGIVAMVFLGLAEIFAGSGQP